jgi:putative transposase
MILAMPRANRYILPGCAYHLTHRCHDRAWLLKFGSDRSEYRRRLRAALRRSKVSLLAYCITSNHVHLLAVADDVEGVPALMQQVQGEFAEYYNRRRRRSGAFWDDRYHCTMIESGEHLWNCATYIDLNMVRAGVVGHPRDWRWCGFDELSGRRRRYLLLDRERVAEHLGGGSADGLARDYEAAVLERLNRCRAEREPEWTESIAVGGQEFVKDVAGRVKGRTRLEMIEGPDGVWNVREAAGEYGQGTPRSGTGVLHAISGAEDRF